LLKITSLSQGETDDCQEHAANDKSDRNGN